MATAVIMPRQGQSVESCVIGEWFKKVGDDVGEGELLFSYETDKAVFEEAAKVSGKLLAVFFGVGDDVPCLETVAVIGAEGEDISGVAPKVEAEPEQREEAMRKGYEALREQFAAVREAYPGAQLHEELESPMFMRLVMRGVDARSAYELTHLQELRAGAMAYGARRAREELTAAMQAGYLRPRESGMAPAAFGAFAESPEHWSRQTREELKARARRGETVRL